MARIAVVQMMASTEKEANLQHVLSCISKAARDGAALVAFPEYMMFYTPSSQTPDQLAALSEEPAGPFVSAVASAAGRHGIEVVGTFYERRRGRGRGRGRGKVYDTSFHIDAGGRLASLYRKIHLYDALGFRESDKMAPGRSIAAPARSPAVGSLGMMVCYDLRFPEMSRTLAQAGSDVIVAPSAWVKGRLKEDHWITINRARAIENGCYMVSPDQVGNIYCGRSIVVDPFGEVLLDMGRRRGIGYAEVDPKMVAKTRRDLPLLQNRRTDIYPSFELAGAPESGSAR